MALADLHERFLDSLRIERQMSEQTITSYRSDFRRFTEYLSRIRKRQELRSFTSEIVRDFQMEYARTIIRGGGYPTPRTVARHIDSLSSFGEWLVRWNCLPLNPVKRLIRPRRERKMKEILTSEQLSALIHMDMTKRDAAMRALLLYIALRRGELVRLTWRDVDVRGRYILLHGKGNKERVLGMAPPLVSALSDYALAVGPKDVLHPVFVGKQGKRIDRHVVNQIVKRWGISIGRPDLHPHLLRATALTFMLEKMDLPTVQDIAGHDDPRTTRGYAQTRPAVLRAKMEEFRYGLEPVEVPEQEVAR
jgi:site-specific recombinase XerC